MRGFGEQKRYKQICKYNSVLDRNRGAMGSSHTFSVKDSEWYRGVSLCCKELQKHDSPHPRLSLSGGAGHFAQLGCWKPSELSCTIAVCGRWAGTPRWILENLQESVAGGSDGTSQSVAGCYV